jgi:hypothetical protein
VKTVLRQAFPVALVMLLACSAQGSEYGLESEYGLNYSDLEQRLATLEAKMASQEGVQSAGYLMHEAGYGTACGCDNTCGDDCGCCDPCCGNPYAGVYASVELLWIRPHVSEDWVGKLSNDYEFSTRTVIGYENDCGLGARIRWWQFDHTIQLQVPAAIGMDVQVVDLEMTNRVSFLNSDLVLGGGLRYAHWGLADQFGDEVTMDSLGLTIAADVFTPICGGGCAHRIGFVYGGRWSVLAGDWHGNNEIIDTVVTPVVHDDNQLVTELYAGLGYWWCRDRCDVFARTTFEMQNWRSDVLGEADIGNGIAPNSIGSTNSIGFLGLGLQLGVLY